MVFEMIFSFGFSLAAIYLVLVQYFSLEFVSDIFALGLAFLSAFLVTLIPTSFCPLLLMALKLA